MKSKTTFSLALIVCFGLTVAAQSKPPSPRAAVQAFFSLLKARKYDALYDFLPAQLQQQTTREQLTQSMKRLDGFLLIDKLEIGRVQERGEFAVVDTMIYGRLKQPMKLNNEEIKEGRASVQQFLFREDGKWKLATADNRSQGFFLKRNPEFNKQFQIVRPRLEFKQNGQWTALGPKRP